MRKMNKKGFTIVELVIVIAVIAILAAVLIPTYSSLVKKANLSADQQAVKQMNTILLSELAGKDDISIKEVQDVLEENGIDVDSYTPMTSGYSFYFDRNENCIILLNEKNEVVYPEAMVNKYNNASQILATWSPLNDEVKTPNKVSTVEEFITALTAENVNNSVITLPENEKIELNDTQYSSLNEALKKGNHITINLNGGTLTLPNNNTSGNDTRKRVYVDQNSTLTIENGTIYADQITVQGGGSLVLDGVTYESNLEGNNIFAVTGIFAASGASQILIVDSKVSAHTYALATNKNITDNTYVEISNSELIARSGTGIICNVVSAKINIFDSTISGAHIGLFVRLGTVNVQNSTMVRTGSDSYGKTTWGSGDDVPYAAVVVGDDNDNGYAGTAHLTISGCTIQSTDTKVVWSADSDTTAEFIYDSSVADSDITKMGTLANNG